MATTIGRVDYLVDLDGKGLPRQARRLGDKAGNELGDSTMKELNEKLKGGIDSPAFVKSAKRLGIRSGIRMGEGFDEGMQRRLARVGQNLEVLNKPIERVTESLDRNNRVMSRTREILDRTTEGLRRTTIVTDGYDRVLKRTVVETDKHNNVLSQTVSSMEDLEKVTTKVRTIMDQHNNVISRVDDTVRKHEDGVTRTTDTLDAHGRVIKSVTREEDRFGGVIETVNKHVEKLDKVTENANVTLDRNGKVLERVVNRTERLADGVRKTTTTFDAFNRKLRETSVFTDHVGNTFTSLEDNTKDLESRGSRLRRTFRRLGDVIQGMLTPLRQFRESWRRAPHGMRQVLLWTGFIVAALPELAGLASAAASGITILAGAALSFGIGTGVAIAGLKNLNDDLADLPAEIRPAAKAFQSIGDALGRLQDRIESRVVADLAPQFNAISDLVDDLGPAFDVVADSVNSVIKQIVDMITSAEGTRKMKQLIKGAAPVFEDLAIAAANIVSALADILIKGQPSIEKFASWLRDISEDFNEWTSSVAGDKSLEEWFSNGERVLSALGDLIGKIGGMLSDLVTDDVIRDLEEFQETLGDLMVPLGEFVTAIGEFNLLENAAKLIQGVLEVINPLNEPLGEAGRLFNTLADILEEHVIPKLTEFTEEVAPKLTALFSELNDLLAILAPLIGPIVDLLVNALSPAITGIIDVLTGLLEFLNGVFTGDWGRAWEGIKTVFMGAVRSVLFLSDDIIAQLQESWSTGVNWISEQWKSGWNSIEKFFSGWVSDIKGYWTDLLSFFGIKTQTGMSRVHGTTQTGMSRTGSAIRQGGGRMKSGWTEAWNGMESSTSRGVTEVVNRSGRLPGQVQGRFSGLGGLLRGSGSSMIDGFWQGLRSTWSSMMSWVSGAMANLRGLWPFSPAKWGPFSGRGYVTHSGKALGEDFGKATQESIKKSIPNIERTLQSVSGAFSSVSMRSGSMQLPGARLSPNADTSIPTTPGPAADSSTTQGAPGAGITFAAGSIVVQGATDPRRVAYEVADLIAERIAS